MQFPAFWADFKSSLYVKSEVKDGEFTESSVTIFNFKFLISRFILLQIFQFL